MSRENSVLLVNFINDAFLKEVANRLIQEKNLRVYNAGYQQLVRRNFHEICFDLDLSIIDNPSKITARILDNYKQSTNREFEEQSRQFQGLFFAMIDRTTLGRFDKNVCEFYYKFLLNYFRTVFQKLSPLMIVFDSTPHMPVEFAMYIAARQLGVKTLYPSRNHLGARVDFRTNISTHNLDSSNVSSTIEHYIDGLNSPWLTRSKEQITSNQLSLSRMFSKRKYIRLLQYLRICVGFIRDGFRIVHNSYWSNHYFNLSRAQSIRILWQHLSNCLSQAESLNKIIVRESNNLPMNYFYYPLQYQPERSTIPEAPEFYDQISAIWRLQGMLPANFKVLVKEHPKQLQFKASNPRPLLYRSSEFYRTISKIPNVILINPSIASEKLIRDARLVASCTGSAIWEALNYGVPCISFAENWLSDFKYAPFILNLEKTEFDINEYLNANKEEVAAALSLFVGRRMEESISTVDSEVVFKKFSKSDKDLFVSNYVRKVLSELQLEKSIEH